MKYHTIVVGAGMAGLTAAAYLAKAGKKVLLLEKSPEVGGLIGSFTHKGYYFDTGPRSVENSAMLLPLFVDLGINLSIERSPVSWGVEDEIVDFNSLEDINRVKSALVRLFPEDRVPIDSIFRRIHRATKLTSCISKVDNPFIRSPLESPSHLLTVVLPWIIPFLVTLLRLPFWAKSMEESLEKRIENQSLRDMLSQHFFKNTPESFALGYYYTYTDYYYPRGGTATIPQALKTFILNHGGEIKTNAEVVAVNARQKHLIDSDKVSWLYDKLIWAADQKNWFKVLDRHDLPRKKRIQKDAGEVIMKRGGESVFCLSMGVDCPLEKFSRISKGHFFYSPSRKGLGQVHRRDLERLIVDFDRITLEELSVWIESYCLKSTYEISIPALRDQALAPQGKTGLMASLLIDGRLFKKIQSAGWYETVKARMAETMIDVLNDSIYPFLKDKVEFAISSTPCTLMNRFNLTTGSITGWSLEEEKSSSLFGILGAVKTPLPDHYKAGQWTYIPAGVPIAILSGKLAAKAAL